jgi:hypothetical protein
VPRNSSVAPGIRRLFFACAWSGLRPSQGSELAALGISSSKLPCSKNKNLADAAIERRIGDRDLLPL